MIPGDTDNLRSSFTPRANQVSLLIPYTCLALHQRRGEDPSQSPQRHCLESGAPWLQKISGDKLCSSTFVPLPLSQMEGLP